MALMSQVKGWGGYLPSQIVTNNELAQRVDTSDEWIFSRSGIKERHIAQPGELTSDLAIAAARKALAQAQVAPEEVDAIILATTTPDETMPATAVKVQQALGANRAFAFDLQAACSGFVYAMAVADNFIRLGQARKALVIGAETMTRLLDWQDRSTCVLFGDGAGALVLEAVESDRSDRGQRGIFSTHLFSDGSFHDALYVNGGPSSPQKGGTLQMVGREVFRHAVKKIGEAVVAALEANGLQAKDIDWFVPHQANVRIIQGVAEHFGLPFEKMIVTIDRHANTSAASIPLALCEAVEDGRLKKGDLIVCEALGAGLTWGASLLRW